MRVTLLCVGKIKERYWKEALAEYEKRLSRYCRTEIIEVADEKTPDGATASLEEQIRKKREPGFYMLCRRIPMSLR